MKLSLIKSFQTLIFLIFFFSGLLKSSHSDLKSGIDKNNLSRTYRRAAASKASDRINRESRGRLSLSSSSSDDSRISDLDDDPNLDRTSGSTITSKIKSKKQEISSDDSDFQIQPVVSEKKRPTGGGQKEINFPSVATSTTSRGCVTSRDEVASDSNSSRPSTSVVKIPLKRKQTTLDGSLEKLQKPKKQKVDEEKENKNTSPVAAVTPTTSLKQLSWPEQLARNKAAR